MSAPGPDGLPDPAPRFPDDPALRGGVAILGAGAIARSGATMLSLM